MSNLKEIYHDLDGERGNDPSFYVIEDTNIDCINPKCKSVKGILHLGLKRLDDTKLPLYLKLQNKKVYWCNWCGKIYSYLT
jgi:hypothetical protein